MLQCNLLIVGFVLINFVRADTHCVIVSLHLSSLDVHLGELLKKIGNAVLRLLAHRVEVLDLLDVVPLSVVSLLTRVLNSLDNFFVDLLIIVDFEANQSEIGAKVFNFYDILKVLLESVL